jgi:hypothetical protein
MKQKIIIISLILFHLSTSFAQKIISGKILDAESKKPLAFANITTEKNTGSISGFDGTFEIKLPENTREITISYIGYQTKKITISPKKNYYTIYLKPSAESLGEVVINGKYVNPAIPLMKKAVKNKKYNDFRKKLNLYAYTKYTKLVIGIDTDKINAEFDTIYQDDKIFKIDSSLYYLKKEYTDKNYWMSENITKVNGKHGIVKKEVIATKTAGLKNPLYELLAIQSNNQEIYDDYYKFLFKKYLGPFSKLSFKQYQYEIDDTITLQNRSVIEISYKNTVKPLISGKIYLDKETLAIAKMTLNTFKDFQFNAVYNFYYYPQYKTWFPQSTDIFIKKAERKNNFNLDDTIIITSRKQDTIKANNNGDTLTHSNKHTSIDYTYAKYISRNLQIKLGENYPLKIKYDLEIHPLASKRNDEFWQQYTGKKPDNKEKNTYNYVDSIAEKENIETKINKFKKIASAYYPVHRYFDLDLLNILDYNRYEGFRIKLGGKTSNAISDKFLFNAYAAYGFKDKELKYSAGIQYKLSQKTQTYIGLDYTKDLDKSGAFNLPENRHLFSLPRHLAHDKFYMQTGFTGKLSHLLFTKLKTELHFTMADIVTKFPIPYHKGRLEFMNKDIAYLRLTTEWTPFAKYYLTPQGRKMIKDGYPKIYFNFEKNFTGLQTDPTDYFRVDLQIDLKKTYLNQDATELVFRTGFAPGGTGIDKLYTPNTNDYDGTNPFKHFNLYQNFAFETMKDYEFADNYLLTLHLIHHLNHIKLGVKKEININIIGRLAYGISDYRNTYTGIRSLENFYYETGLEFHKLVANFGLGFYYRLGKYAYTDALNNLSIRLTISPFKLFSE